MALDGNELFNPQQVLDQSDPNLVPDVLRQMALGTMLTPMKVTVTGLTAAAAFDLTSTAVQAAATVNNGAAQFTPGVTPSPVALPPALVVSTLRVTAVGSGATGPRTVTDAGGTPVAPSAGIAGVATISDDGKTLTFEGTVTGFIIEYVPRAAVDMQNGSFEAPGQNQL
jgi:hypothetical protein